MQKSNPFSLSEVYDDHFTMDDVSILHRAARMMKISAAQFINIAHIQHFHEKPSLRKLRTLNNAFVFKDEVPPWAIDFAHEISEQFKNKTYDSWRYGIRPDQEAPYKFQFGNYRILIPFIITLLLYMAFAH